MKKVTFRAIEKGLEIVKDCVGETSSNVYFHDVNA